ncbi:hypothetical protein OU798_13660 [Prolixibacteraceae bacterium Z1-6]|uniref:Uncharacterized protein n=1 Tax=Draconibacterium aestuarii TaxID=2998507 RepID=A0A9X3F7X0_9BACT|nr:hypothetical protein [Prolixibacteraceae bacterium Z1-6]
MKTLLSLLILLPGFVSCNTPSKKKPESLQEKASVYKLEIVWESDTSLKTPESVLIDHERNLLYVSCVNENPWELDGNGFISKMDRSGKILDLKWIEGLNGPKGMGISGNSLFIADINTLVEADIESGEIINKIELEGTPQLNDITVADDGTVYVSSSGTSIIYQLNNGRLEPILQGEADERFNGLFWEKDRMLIITSGSSQFKEIPWGTMKPRIITENMGHGDGIASVGNGDYITSDWQGSVSYVSENGEIKQLLDTKAQEENAADIDFCIDNQILYIPTFFKNQVKAYKLVKN